MVNIKTAPIFKRILEAGIRPKTRKDSQKAAGGKYEDPAFTIRAFTMMPPYAKRMIY